MERWRDTTSRPADWPGAVVTIGMFDGVHRGHQAVLHDLVARARDASLPAVVLTFEPHPVEVISPGSHPALLTGLQHKAELIEACGVDVLCLIPFTLAFSRLTPREFVERVLVDPLRAHEVVVGANFHFGQGAEGDTEILSQLGAELGFRVDPLPLHSDGGARFSSTVIRRHIAAGDVEAAAVDLGRDHRVVGRVVRGDARGRDLGFPTANVEALAYSAIPADGVYAGRFLRRDGTRAAAAISVGTNPTFGGEDRRVEAYLLDFDGDLYGEPAAIEFTTRLRGQRRFDGVEPLVEQMTRDVAQVRALQARLLP